MPVRGSVERMTQIFPRKSEPAFPVSGFQQTRSRISESPPVTRSIASLGCLQPAALARSNRLDREDRLEECGKRSKETMRLQQLERRSELLLHEEVVVLRSLSGENLDVFIHELFLSKRRRYARRN